MKSELQAFCCVLQTMKGASTERSAATVKLRFLCVLSSLKSGEDCVLLGLAAHVLFWAISIYNTLKTKIYVHP